MLDKNFQETASRTIVLSFFIHTISSKHYRDYLYCIQASWLKFNASHIH